MHTDHKNLLAQNSVNNRVFRWKQKIAEYDTKLIYVKGENNIEADALSRLPREEIETSKPTESMLNHPPVIPNHPLYNQFPLDSQLIAQQQALDRPLQQFIINNTEFYKEIINDQEIIMRKSEDPIEDAL